MPYVASRSPFTVTVTFSDERGPDDDAEQGEGPPHSTRLTRPSSLSRMNPPPVPFPTAFPASLISATSAKSNQPMQHAFSPDSIILSNGRSLRPSLKSSSSSPLLDDKSSPVSHPGVSRSRSMPTYGHKNVHFKEKEDGLESVRLFRHKGKPISVSKPTLNTETESEVTESESSPFPFPPNNFGPSTSLSEIADCSPIPASSPSPYANVHLESVTLLPFRPQVLQGTVLVRNIVFEKDVGVRFTLDDWTTVSEVLAAYTGPVAAMETLAGSNQGKTVEDLVGPSKASGWDRFNFAIKLEDYELSIWRHTLFLAIRYFSPGVGEFWDNNSGENYRIAFRARGNPAQPQPRRTPGPGLH